MAAVMAFVIVGGGVLYWRLQQENAAQLVQATTLASANTNQQITAANEKAGMTPGEIANKYGNSTVLIEFTWRLFDKETGRPVYHKAFTPTINGKAQQKLPAYLKLNTGAVVPWLTTDDDEHRNYEIKGGGSGSGFVVSTQGYILTNRHVAASWRNGVSPESYARADKGYLLTKDSKGKIGWELIDAKRLARDYFSWIPEDENGYLFNSGFLAAGKTLQLPEITSKTVVAQFAGRNESLTVRFPHTRLSINAELTSSSTDDDVALIKINSPEPLVPLELAVDDEVKQGDRAIVLGYPGMSAKTVMTIETSQGKRQEVIPEVTVTDGIVQRVGTQVVQEGTKRVQGTKGDTLQLSVQSSAGNSGGPVFNANGKVIGLFTFGYTFIDTTVNYAVRIKHGRNLLKPQMN